MLFLKQPLDQFDIYISNNLFNLNYKGIFLKDLFVFFVTNDFLNSFIYLFILFSLIFYLISLSLLNKLNIAYNSIWQYVYEEFIYKFILNILISQAGKKSQQYFVYILTLFYFILLSNMIGLIPDSFTLTSHIFLTFLFGSISIIGLTIIGFIKQKLHFLQLFVPKGVPKFLLPLLILIEIVSYIARGFSLSIRLFANLMSGHSLIHILLFFIIKIFKANFFFGYFALILISIIFLLEIGISFLQAYVFAVLVSIYLNDSFDVGH